jgi:ribulose-5-phosphate 4-epimerase/fuculose-1-phosphate aldolase
MVVVLSMAGRELVPASNPGALFGPGPIPVYQDPALIHTDEQGDAVAKTLGQREAVILRGHGSVVAGETVEWVFAGCVDLEESALRFYMASTLGPVRAYTDNETNRVAKGRRRLPVIQKIWDHYVAKTRTAGLMNGID